MTKKLKPKNDAKPSLTFQTRLPTKKQMQKALARLEKQLADLEKLKTVSPKIWSMRITI